MITKKQLFWHQSHTKRPKHCHLLMSLFSIDNGFMFEKYFWEKKQSIYKELTKKSKFWRKFLKRPPTSAAKCITWVGLCFWKNSTVAFLSLLSFYLQTKIKIIISNTNTTSRLLLTLNLNPWTIGTWMFHLLFHLPFRRHA